MLTFCEAVGAITLFIYYYYYGAGSRCLSSVCTLSMSLCHPFRPRASLSSWHSWLSVVRLGGSVRVHAGVFR